MSRIENQIFLELALLAIPSATHSETRGLLWKMVVVFKIVFTNSARGTGMNMGFLIMEILLYYTKVTNSYDLKGSVGTRLITEGESQSAKLLLDENLVRVSCESC